MEQKQDEEQTGIEIVIGLTLLVVTAWVAVTIIHWVMQGQRINPSSLGEIIAAQIEYIGNLRIW